MKKTTAKQLNIGLIPSTLILAAVTLGFILLVNLASQQNAVNKVPSEPITQNSSVIKNTTDLDTASKQLDNIDPNALDQNLDAVTTDNSVI